MEPYNCIVKESKDGENIDIIMERSGSRFGVRVSKKGMEYKTGETIRDSLTNIMQGLTEKLNEDLKCHTHQ